MKNIVNNLFNPILNVTEKIILWSFLKFVLRIIKKHIQIPNIKINNRK